MTMFTYYLELALLCLRRNKALTARMVLAIALGIGASIVGLTSFWICQRHRQIGGWLALGARKIDILRYFQIENLLIAGGGVVLELFLALGLNLWLMKRFEMERMPLPYVLIGVLVMLVLGQIAVFVAARRASHVPPVVATRAT